MGGGGRAAAGAASARAVLWSYPSRCASLFFFPFLRGDFLVLSSSFKRLSPFLHVLKVFCFFFSAEKKCIKENKNRVPAFLAQSTRKERKDRVLAVLGEWGVPDWIGAVVSANLGRPLFCPPKV